MTKQIAFISIIMLRIFIHPSYDKNHSTPFASPSPLSTSTISAPVDVIRTNANERLIHKWIIGDNRPGFCYNSFNVPGFTKKDAAKGVSTASKGRSVLLLKTKANYNA